MYTSRDQCWALTTDEPCAKRKKKACILDLNNHECLIPGRVDFHKMLGNHRWLDDRKDFFYCPPDHIPPRSHIYGRNGTLLYSMTRRRRDWWKSSIEQQAFRNEVLSFWQSQLGEKHQSQAEERVDCYPWNEMSISLRVAAWCLLPLHEQQHFLDGTRTPSQEHG